MKHPRLISQLFHHEEKYSLVLSKILSEEASSRSYLITGKKGIGKASFVYKLAKELLNKDGIESQTHPDFLGIEKRVDEKTGKEKKEILVDDAKKINEFLALSSAHGGWRIVLIDSACEMNTSAANRILKTLEEPPKKTLIFMLSHGRKIMPTLRSRCQVIKLRRLPEEDIISILEGNYPELAQEQRKDLSKISNGSANIACTLASTDNYEIFQETKTVLDNINNLHFPTLKSITDKIGKNKDALPIVSLAINNFMDEVIKNKAGINNQPDLLGESNSDHNIKDFEQLLNIKQTYNSEFNEMQVFNLDAKAFVINKVSSLSQVFSS